MTNREAAVLWVIAYGAALTAFVARIFWLLGAVSGDPPDDPVELHKWQRRRRWMAISEFAALPLFATFSVLAAAQGWLSPVAAVFAALISGALGFAFFVHALEQIVRRRAGLQEKPDAQP